MARIEYKFLSPTYKVLTTTQPPYLHHLTSVQPPRSTCSSSLVTLARPPTSSSLHITDRCFRYVSRCLWNQLPSSLRQPYSSPSVSVHAPAHIFLLSQLTTLTIHNSVSLSLPAQDLPLSQIFPSIDSFQPQDWLHGLHDWTVSSSMSVFFVFSFFITLYGRPM